MTTRSRSSYRKALRDLQAGGFTPAQIMGLMKVFENYIEPMSARLDTMIDVLRSIDQKTGAETQAAPPPPVKRRARKNPPAASRRSKAKSAKR